MFIELTIKSHNSRALFNINHIHVYERPDDKGTRIICNNTGQNIFEMVTESYDDVKKLIEDACHGA